MVWGSEDLVGHIVLFLVPLQESKETTTLAELYGACRRLVPLVRLSVVSRLHWRVCGARLLSSRLGLLFQDFPMERYANPRCEWSLVELLNRYKDFKTTIETKYAAYYKVYASEDVVQKVFRALRGDRHRLTSPEWCWNNL